MFGKVIRHIGLLILAGLLSAQASAIGLGEIKLNTALNEPLNAEIPLLDVKGLSENDIIVGIAPKADYDTAGVDRLSLLSSLKFSLDLNNAKGPLVRVTTDSPIREPYLNFLVEVQWPSGRLLREYTLLMDLPASDSSNMNGHVIKGTETSTLVMSKDKKVKPSPIDVKELETELASVDSSSEVPSAPVVPAGTAPDRSSSDASVGKKSRSSKKLAQEQEAAPKNSVAKHKIKAVKKEQQKPELAKKKHEQAKIADVSKAVEEPEHHERKPAVVPVYSSAPSESNYPVKAGDSLWFIAMKYGQTNEGLTVQQSMLAIQRMNPDAFVKGNINQLKTGRILRMPTYDDMANMTSREAINEVRKQNIAWSGNADGKKSTAAGVTEQIDATHQTATAEAPVSESDQGHLKLSVPGAAEGLSNGKAGGAKETGAVDALQNELSTAMEELDRHKLEKSSVSSKLVGIDDQTKTMQQMLDVRNAELAALQASMAKKAQQAAAAPVTPPPAEPTATVQAPTASTELPAPEKSEPMHEASTPTPSPTPVAPPAEPVKTQAASSESSSNMGWIVGGVITLILLVVIFAKLRGRGDDIDLASRVEQATAPEASSPSPASVTGVVGALETTAVSDVKERVEPLVAAAPVAASKPETSDAIGEADIYISFGTYDKAESLLKGAISAEPKRADLRLKLLEVYVGTENLRAFDEQLSGLVAIQNADATRRAQELRGKIAAPVVAAPVVAAPVVAAPVVAAPVVAAPVVAAPVVAAPVVAAPVVAAPSPEKVDESHDSDLHFDLDLAEDASVELGSDITAKSKVIAPPEEDGGLDLDIEMADESSKNDPTIRTQKVNISDAPTVQQRALDLSQLTTGVTPALKVGQARTEVRDALDMNKVAEKAEPISLDLESTSESAVSLHDAPTVQQRALDISQLKTGVTPAVKVGQAHTEIRDSIDMNQMDQEKDSSTTPTGSNDIVTGLDEDLDFTVDADEVATKLDLAKAYIDMGDKEGAKDILQEVMEEGQPAQKQEAKKLLDSIV